ncbi:MAG: SpoIID/LytB domain-containing protein [Deltaproteobacteria bacterium]|nr:SpoIID/LytB domain-containing protein [Deltaproteobacteria bacterium]
MTTIGLIMAAIAAMAFASKPPLSPNSSDVFTQLYDKKVTLTKNSEPLITVGVVNDTEQVTLRADSTVDIDFWQAGQQRHYTINNGESIRIKVNQATTATRQYYVDFAGSSYGDEIKLKQVLATWTNKGIKQIKVNTEGMILPLRYRAIDNREYRLYINATNQAEAQQQATDFFYRFGVHAEVKTKLTKLPHGNLEVFATKRVLGVATDYIHLQAASGILQVDKVEYGRGYRWHGYEDRSYRGELYIAINPEGNLAVINVLGIENLLEGTVPAELYASSPKEALKAQAVAARNHMLAKLGRRHHADPFQLCSFQHCQVYAGTSREDPRSKEAIKETAGQVLFLNNRLVDCVYSASCGGYTEDNDAVWGDEPDPALRGRPDFDVHEHPELAPFVAGLNEKLIPAWINITPKSFCANAAKEASQKVRWSRTFKADELSKLLQPQYGNIGALRDLVIKRRGVGGKVIILSLIGKLGSVDVIHELPIRRLFNNLNSAAFIIDISRNQAGDLTEVAFHGAGWGHGVGMCQLGAIGRAQALHTFDQILAHYYNGAYLEKLY